MASIVSRPKGHHWIQFRLAGKRKTLRLGPSTREQARIAKSQIESLASAYHLGERVPPPAAAWVTGLSPTLQRRLAATGLYVGSSKVCVGQLIGAFKASLDVKASTARNIDRGCANLLLFFGKDRPVESITEADAQSFRAWLGKHEGLARTTINRRCRRAKQIFSFAVRSRWIDRSPFEVIPGGHEINRERDFWVEADLFQAILEEIPDLEFRALLVLSRIGALRCPSEILPLTWRDVNWAKDTLTVHSSKTAAHPNGAVRFAPLWPDMRAVLTELLEQAAEGATLIFPHYQNSCTRLRRLLERACWQAGHPIWPKPFQNMRATRESELLCEYPVHVVAAWLGHSPAVAHAHYAQLAKSMDAGKAAQRGSSVLRFGASNKSEAKSEAKYGANLRRIAPP